MWGGGPRDGCVLRQPVLGGGPSPHSLKPHTDNSLNTHKSGVLPGAQGWHTQQQASELACRASSNGVSPHLTRGALCSALNAQPSAHGEAP